MTIPFNKPFFTGKETLYIKDTVNRGQISGNGYYTKKCQLFLQQKYGFTKCLLTTSCTDALEMAAILINIMPGDEVIIPSFTFVSTANAFVLRGAKIIFADSRTDHPGFDESKLESLITSKTKVIVPVHYAGVSCDMDLIMALAEKYSLYVVEDAAQAIDGYYTSYKGVKKPLGSIGHFAAFSFHETKNIISGEGGMLVINDKEFIKRSEIIWEKGTNRSAFFNGEVDKYGWVDIGSSFLPSEIISAFLYAQLENLDKIQTKRNKIWEQYFTQLNILELKNKLLLPKIPGFSSNNSHMFYLICNSRSQRDELIAFLKDNGVHSVFHYLALNKSKYIENNDYEAYQINNHNADFFSDHLVRLPFYYALKEDDIKYICGLIKRFFK